jgi:putative inorganic carbon (hco3(-)) transporter
MSCSIESQTRFGQHHRAAKPAEPAAEQRWGLDFIGLLFYIFIEYTRLPIMFPALAVLQLGKVSLLLAMLGAVVSRPTPSADDNRLLKLAVLLLGVFTCISSLTAQYTVVPVGALWNIPEQLIAVFLIGRALTSRWRCIGFTVLLLLLDLKVAQHGLRYYAAEHGRAANEMAFVQFGIIGGGGGFYDNSADLGVAMCVVFGLSLALCQANIGRKSRIFFLICLLAFGALILVCGSRGAIVGGAAIVLASWVKSPKKSWSPVFALLFAAGLVYLMPHASRDRFESAENWQGDKTANHRVLLWQAGLHMWADYPIFGVGPANYRYVRQAAYRIDAQNDRDAYVCHSLYIEVISELGTLGTLAAAAIFVFFFVLTRRVRHRLIASGAGRESWEFCLSSGLELAMIGYLASGAFVSVFWYPHIWVLSGLAMGLNTATASSMLTPDSTLGCECLRSEHPSLGSIRAQPADSGL